MIYLDNAATTEPRYLDINLMLSYWGNPSSQHFKGELSQKVVDYSKKKIISLLVSENCEDDYDIIFTSGGSEANNLAILGLRYSSKKHIITSSIEHKSVLNACKELEEHYGFRVTYLPVNSGGFISVEDIKKSICDDTVLVSIMGANNEVGSVQPIKEISEICKENNVLFHTDAVQLNYHCKDYSGIDMVSLSGHKFHSVKGIGCLIKHKDVKLSPIIFGGNQQGGLRAGTENVFGIINMYHNLNTLYLNSDSVFYKTEYYKQKMIEALSKDKRICINQDLFLNGENDYLPNIISISTKKIPADAIQMILSKKGICVSNGAACNSLSLDPSYVLLNMGFSKERALNTLRISFPPLIDCINQDSLDIAVEEIIKAIDTAERIFCNKGETYESKN